MGYLICNTCLGYYELQEGESPEDFDACHCYGTLVYCSSLDEVDNVINFDFPNETKEKQLMSIQKQNHKIWYADGKKEQQLRLIKTLNRDK